MLLIISDLIYRRYLLYIFIAIYINGAMEGEALMAPFVLLMLLL